MVRAARADPAAVDAALARLEADGVWVREADGTRRSMAALKDMTSQLIGRFCPARIDATREIYGPDPLTRYNAEMVVPEETQLEIAVMKGLATTFVMTTDQRQPLYARQREVLTDLVPSSPPPATGTLNQCLPLTGGKLPTTPPGSVWSSTRWPRSRTGPPLALHEPWCGPGSCTLVGTRVRCRGGKVEAWPA